MLIEFEVANFLSFRDPVRFSMVASRPVKEYQEDNVFEAGRHRLLKSAAVYGANASGKSNLMNALVKMRWLVLNSSKQTQATEPIRVSPFKLDVACETRPSRFEIRFLLDELTYRYGYEVDRQKVQAEWLFMAKKRTERQLFLRKGSEIEVTNRFAEGRGIEEKTRDNALFLSVVAQFNGETATRILEWFSRAMPLHGLHDNYVGRSVEMLQDGQRQSRLLELMRKADFGIEAMSATEEKADIESEVLRFLTEEGKQQFLQGIAKVKTFSIKGLHPKYKGNLRVGTAALDLDSEESAGTQKFFHLAGPILDGLEEGRLVIVDELDARLHPNLTCAIVRLFNSKETNPRNAQLVFCTHDTNLLSGGKLRRDQVWFVEKNQEGATGLYSLAEMKLSKGTKVRNDAAFEKNYIQGRYGAVPFLADFADVFAGGSHGQADQVK